MPLLSTRARYGAVAQGFHWLTLILVAAAYVLSVEGPPSRIFSPENAGALGLHETLGVLVLLVTCLRLLWRLADTPPQEQPMPGWMLLAAKAGHLALYLLLFAVPLTAILGSWFGSHAVTLIAVGDVASPLGVNAGLGETLLEVHGTLGNLIVILAGLHAAAALFHHFFLRDRVLKSMLPMDGG